MSGFPASVVGFVGRSEIGGTTRAGPAEAKRRRDEFLEDRLVSLAAFKTRHCQVPATAKSVLMLSFSPDG